MDKCSSDAEFDSYWDYEAKNKNRNRIRVGRQYQATVPPLLKPGEKDGRKSEDLETLKWKPDKLSDQEVEQYLSMAKGVGLFAKAVDNSRIPEKPDNTLQSAIKGLSEFVASHHPCHHDDGCQIPKPSCSGESSSKIIMAKDWSPCEAQLFAQALETCGKNFCAIKKEYLPWKPVRSIIEYYYQGKGEKPQNFAEDITEPEEKKEVEPVACCSHDVNEKVETAAIENSPVIEKSVNEPEVFLEKNEGSEDCEEKPEIKMSGGEDSASVLSTVGSLKFFLGGRLVLKLNAQQDYGSGTKCQWVQSNDLPKHSNSAKKVKHKKKSIQEGSISVTVESPKHKKKSNELPSSAVRNSPECDISVAKKLKLNSEYDFTECDTQGALLCSSSWTPPVADGQESVELDDCSSKTSEGYISPVLPNSRYAKVDIKTDLIGNPSSMHDFNDINEQKCDSSMCSIKPESQTSSIQSEGSFAEDSASKNVYLGTGKNSLNQFGDDTGYNQEVLNHKSALSHNKHCIKSPCYLPPTTHSSSSSLKQWNKLSNMPPSERAKTSSSSQSPLSVVDSKSPIKDIPLDLTSKLEILRDNHDHCNTPKAVLKTVVKVECSDTFMPSKSEIQSLKSEFSPKSSNCQLHSQNNSSHKVKCENESTCQSVGTVKAEDPQFADAVKNENCECSPSKKSGDAGHLSYSYCNLPFHCALPKCTKDYSLEEHLCNKNDTEKNASNNSDYILHDVDDDLCKKNPAWCSKSMASYLQFYPQCYPYYLAYGMASSPVPESVVAEVPLDLSSGNENIKEKTAGSDKLPEDVTVASQNNADAVERGMLYQLLQNKTSK